MSKDTTIRQGAVSLLRAALPTVDVYDSRAAKLPETGRPAVVVYTPQQNGETVASTGAMYRMSTELRIECHQPTPAGTTHAEADADLAEALDALVDATLRALFTHATWLKNWEKPPSIRRMSGQDAESQTRKAAAILDLSGTYTETWTPVDGEALARLMIKWDTAPLDEPDGVYERVELIGEPLPEEAP